MTRAAPCISCALGERVGKQPQGHAAAAGAGGAGRVAGGVPADAGEGEAHRSHALHADGQGGHRASAWKRVDEKQTYRCIYFYFYIYYI